MVEAHLNKLFLKKTQGFSRANSNPLMTGQKTWFRLNPNFQSVFFFLT